MLATLIILWASLTSAKATTSSTVSSTTMVVAFTAHDVRPFKEVQAEVEELLSSNDRTKALEVIAGRLKDEKREPTRSDLRKLQDTTSELFLTEKGLQAYQLGRSLVFSDLNLAHSRFAEAQALEHENIQLNVSIARARLQAGDCAQALKEVKRGLVLNENYRQLLLIKLQALVCLQYTKEASTFLEDAFSDATVDSTILLLLAKGQLALLQQEYVKANQSFEKAKGLDSKMPEVYYWLGQSSDLSKKDSNGFYRNYLELCQEPTRERRRQYDIEPRTCLEAKAIEHLLESRIGKAKG